MKKRLSPQIRKATDGFFTAEYFNFQIVLVRYFQIVDYMQGAFLVIGIILKLRGMRMVKA